MAYATNCSETQQDRTTQQESFTKKKYEENSFQRSEASPQMQAQNHTVPGHKKSQSMINSKIANLLGKGGNTTGHQRANASLGFNTKAGDQGINRSIDRLISGHK
jgi:hypothetical protein